MSAVQFKTNTLLKSLIGKDLINDDNIAILELVKNSCDADADTIKVEFHNLSDKDQGKLIVYDNGAGMNDDDVKNKWLNIAYSEKSEKKSKRGKYLAGNKGIGRFSCDRLGSRLDMFTRKENGDLLYLNIDWTMFEIEGKRDKTIQSIIMDMKKTTDKIAKEKIGKPMPEKGTVLVITGLRSSWERKGLLNLKHYLEKFIGPNQSFLNDGFSISLVVPEKLKDDSGKEYHDRINGKITNTIFDKLKFKTTYIKSSISEDGKLINTELFHEGEKVYELAERNTFDKLRNVHIVIYYLNPYKKAYFTRQTGIRSVNFGSVFLFLNGFRVSPYGDRGDDWLGLDVRKAQGTRSYLSSRDVVGRIEVMDRGEGFKPVSSREGLKGTPEFKQLHDREKRDGYYMNVHKRLEKFVVDGLNWDSVPIEIRKELVNESKLDWEQTAENYSESWDRKRTRISLSILSLIGGSKKDIQHLWFNHLLLEDVVKERQTEVQNLLSSIEGFDKGVIDKNLKVNLGKFRSILEKKEQEIERGKEAISSLEKTKKEQTSKINRLEKDVKAYETQTLFLKSISTQDEDVLLGFHHQICIDSEKINNYIAKTFKALRGEVNVKEALEQVEKISTSNKKIMATAQFATRANFRAASKKELTDIPSYFQQYLENVSSEFLASGINLHIKNECNESFQIKAIKLELSMVIDNLVSNAVKARASNLDVRIGAVHKNRLSITFTDNGKGLENYADTNRLFDMGVTDTSGSGLGLYQTRQILDSLDASIKFIEQDKGACLALEFMR